MDFPSLPNISDAALETTDALTSKFSGFAQDVSSSCDILGTIGAIKDKITQFIVDEVTGIITEVKVAVSEVMSDIKDKLSEMFAGSGSVLNTIKGYIKQGQELAAEIVSKVNEISASIMVELHNLMNTINDAIEFATNTVREAIEGVVETMDAVKAKLSDAVAGIKMGMCSTLSSVLAGSPSDAFANITEGATDTAMQSLGAVKDIYNSGAESLMEVTGAVAEAAGVSTVVNGLQSAAGAAANIAGGVVGDATSAIGNSIASMQSILDGIA